MDYYQNSLSDIDKERLKDLLCEMEQASKEEVGYPVNLDFDYSELYPFLGYSINNVGDPFEDAIYKINTVKFEREVIQFFADITELPKDETWGYVTNGGTEGNMYGIFLARETLPNAIVYYCEDTHYSVGKALKLLNVRNIMIRRQNNGEMDYEDLRESIKYHRESSAIIFTTIGTTMTGAIDNIAKIKHMLKEIRFEEKSYIHADAALSGMIAPFLNEPPKWNFAHGIDSISISGHKFIGSPIPCGIVLAKKSKMRYIARAVEYIGSLDTTLTGSRNGITPLFLWYAIKRHGKEGFKKLVKECLETAEYAVNELNKTGIKAWRNKYSNTVVFPKPNDKIVNKWQLAIHGDIAHMITMPNVPKEKIDLFLADIKLTV